MELIEVYDNCEKRMQKSIDSLEYDYAALRAGRANPGVLDKVQVDYYGVPTPVNQMAAISVSEARILTIQPWDISLLNAIERAIQASDIGINPQNDGKVLRLIFPQPTEERRRELVKSAHKRAEDGKVSIRSTRREFIDKVKKMKKNSEITEDDEKIADKEIQELTDKYIKKVDGCLAQKEKEIMEI